jgi:uncharacterized protein (TIGR00304 family)
LSSPLTRWGPFVLAGILVGGGIALLADAIVHGTASAGIFLIFPFVVSSSPLAALGVLALVLGVFVLFFGMAMRQEEDEGAGQAPPAPAGTGRGNPTGAGPGSRPSASYGGFLFVGPVPVVFGNRPGWAPYLVALALATAIALLALVLWFILG